MIERFMLLKPDISVGLMRHLVYIQTLPYLYNAPQPKLSEPSTSVKNTK